MAQKVVYYLSARQILLIAFASALIAAGTMVLLNNYGNLWRASDNAGVTFAEEVPTGISNPAEVSDEQNNIEVYKTISPGVAFITSTTVREDFFGNVSERPDGSGSGSVIDREGHILTNYHVIEGARNLTVSFGGTKTYPAKVVGGDPDTDLAVIKIEPPPEGLTVISFGDSNNLIVGQKVLAIGNPFGLDRTLTTGVISGLQRPIRSVSAPGAPNGRIIEGAIQTDASINPGNSGGPLLDKFGRMIGINSQILSRSGGSVGVGFAIPVNIAKRVVPQLIRSGAVIRPKLGIGSQDVGVLLNRGVPLPVKEGLLVINVARGGAAERAGLRGVSQDSAGEIVLGDIITAVDGEKVTSQDDLYRILDRKQINDTVQVQYLRDGRQLTVPVRLIPLPQSQPSIQQGSPRRGGL